MSLSSGVSVNGPAWFIGPAVGALAAYGVSALGMRALRPWLSGVLSAGWLMHALALGLLVTGLGRADGGLHFGFAAALSATAWLVIGVHEVESRLLPVPGVRRVLAACGVAAVALLLAFPGEPLVPEASRWLPLHWMLGMASYGLFGAAVLHAVLLDAADRRMRSKVPAAGPGPLGMPLLALEKLTFRFVEAGFVVLSLALLLGLVTGAQSDGWRWDHKTVFSMLGWAVFAGLIAGRRLRGWRGRKATRWLYVGAALLLLAYVGSRFVLEVLLQAR
jgi:ABC-type uncharacterized transport system permease subunit